MHRPRVIPVLLLKGNTLWKSVQFGKHNYIGDPINAVRLFNDLKADELIILDINASREKRCIDLEIVREIGEEANMPFAVGGGIKTVEQIRAIIGAGAEKVVLNSVALQNPPFVLEAVEAFGSSTIAVCIDAKKKFLGGLKVYDHVSGKFTEKEPVVYAKELESMGVGEIIIQSVDRDGTMQGYDLELVDQVNKMVSLPVVALGGAGSMENLKDLYFKTKLNGLAAGSLFIYQGNNKGVLISYPNREEIRAIQS